MSTIFDPSGAPIEIAPGRGDLRYTSQPWAIRRDAGETYRIGRSPISYGNLFATQPWIAAAVMRMLTWAVRVPIKVYRRKSDDERQQLKPEEHPLARIVKRPWLGPGASPAGLVQALLGPVLVHGNTVLELETIGGEDWLKPLDWRNLEPVGPDSGLEILGWEYEAEGDEHTVPVSRAVHVAWWSPLGPLGVSPLEQLGTTIAIEDAAQRYQAHLFANGARPPSAITASPEFLAMERTDRQLLIDQLREDIDDIYAGPDNAGKPALLPPGLDWVGVGHTAAEAELINQRQVAREEVAAVYQIPPPMMGILDNATYSNIETQREMAYTMSLGPPLQLIEQTLTTTLARDFYGEADLYIEFDFGPVLRGDRAQEVAVFQSGIQTGIYTPNEARRALNMPAEDAELADKIYLPLNNLQPLGDEMPQEAAPPAEAPVPAEEEVPVEGGPFDPIEWILASAWPDLFAYDEDQLRDPNTGRWIRMGFPKLGGDPRAVLFEDPYHTSEETRASPRFKPKPKPTASPKRKGETDKEYEERAGLEISRKGQKKIYRTPVQLLPEIQQKIEPMKPGGKPKRFPEGTLIERTASGEDGSFYRIDGPDGTFFRVPAHEAARVVEFEEETARANRYGETIPGNPMIRLMGYDYLPGEREEEDPIAATIGALVHGTGAPLPRGTFARRRAAEEGEGDFFDIESVHGQITSVPATDKERVLEVCRMYERQAEGRQGGVPKPPKEYGPTRRAKNKDSQLQPLSKKFAASRIASHAVSERVLGYEQGGREIALINTPGGFGTPVYANRDGLPEQLVVEGDEIVRYVDGREVTRSKLPNVDRSSAVQLGRFFDFADSALRDTRDVGEPNSKPTTDEHFDAPILWPEHFDMAVELGGSPDKNPDGTTNQAGPNTRKAVYGASPGDENHPEPYFYVGPWRKDLPGDEEDWNATGFHGAELTYREVLASDDPEKTVREFYAKYLKMLGAYEKRKKEREQRGIGEMKTMPWKEPPPPKGKNVGIGGAGGYSSDDAAGSMTALGQEGEELVMKLLGGKILHPEGKETSRLDVQVNGYGLEVKGASVNVEAYKATPKKSEMAQKIADAREKGVKPALSIVVVDRDTGQAHVYWRPGLNTGRLLEHTGWRYAGSVPLGTPRFNPDGSPKIGVTAAFDGSVLALGDWEEHEHPRGQPDNPGKFRRKVDTLIEEKMLTMSISNVTSFGHGISTTYQARLEDGTPVMIKVSDAHDQWVRQMNDASNRYAHSAASMRVADALGLPTPRRVTRKTKTLKPHPTNEYGDRIQLPDEIEVSEFLPNLEDHPEERASTPPLTQDFAERVAVLDYLIANSDRHNGNWATAGEDSESKQLYMLDHDNTFPNTTELESGGNAFTFSTPDPNNQGLSITIDGRPMSAELQKTLEDMRDNKPEWLRLAYRKDKLSAEEFDLFWDRLTALVGKKKGEHKLVVRIPSPDLYQEDYMGHDHAYVMEGQSPVTPNEPMEGPTGTQDDEFWSRVRQWREQENQKT